LFIAGEEWEAKEADDTTNYVNRVKTYAGIPQQAFVITLQHNPLYWEEHLVHGQGIPVPQLTLSGHTHAGQISLFGMRPTMLSYKEDYGLHQLEGKYLYVTAGLGGLVPIRLGTTPEIAVITLHRLKK
jgi:predicted MPP superfamily phosphohydrolase